MATISAALGSMAATLRKAPSLQAPQPPQVPQSFTAGDAVTATTMRAPTGGIAPQPLPGKDPYGEWNTSTRFADGAPRTVRATTETDANARGFTGGIGQVDSRGNMDLRGAQMTPAMKAETDAIFGNPGAKIENMLDPELRAIRDRSQSVDPTGDPMFTSYKPKPAVGGTAPGSSTNPAPAPAPAPGASPTPAPSTLPATRGIAPTSAAGGLDAILASNSPLMRRAEQSGLNTANKRGLLHSSIAAEAAQGAMIDRATPIALQDAATASNERMQDRDINAQMSRLEKQLSSAEGIEKTRIQAEMERLNKQIGSEMDRLKLSLSSSDSQQAKAIGAEMEKLQKQLDTATAQQRTEIQAQLERLKIAGGQEIERVKLQGSIESALSSQGATQQQALQTLQGQIQSALQSQGDAATMARLKASFDQDVAMQQKAQANTLAQIAATGDQNLRQLLQQQDGSLKELSMNIAAGDRQRIAELSVAVFAQESAMRQALLANPNMPASERAAYERAISSMGDPVRNYLGKLYAPPGASGGQGGIAPPPANAPVAAPSGGIAPVGFAPGAVDSGPMAGSFYRNGRFFDAAGNEVPR